MLERLFNWLTHKSASSVNQARRKEIDRILKQVNVDNFKNVQEIITQEQMDNLLLKYNTGK